MAGARELRLVGLGLTEIPAEIFGLAETLEVLDLGKNALTSLPDDFGRLKALKILFCSGNPMDCLPPVLGACAELGQIGFRGCGMREVPADALPARLRWLTLTDNALDTMPDAIGERPLLQKLMLAGNRLRDLPEELCAAPRLELLRVSANRFETLPPWLPSMPRLAWLAFAGNPLDAAREAPTARHIPWAALTLGMLLGEGASGRVHAARWRTDECDVAVKLFKGSMTSDGLPENEMAACLAAGPHPGLAGAIGRVSDHPLGLDALVMPLLPAHWHALAAPPSLASCSRDIYDPALRFGSGAAAGIAVVTAQAGAHLHGRGLLHGDLYAHNILWDGSKGDAVLSDLGAAAFMPAALSSSLAKLDVLAFGILLGELVARCEEGTTRASLEKVVHASTDPEPRARPTMVALADALRGLGS